MFSKEELNNVLASIGRAFLQLHLHGFRALTDGQTQNGFSGMHLPQKQRLLFPELLSIGKRPLSVVSLWGIPYLNRGRRPKEDL